MLKWNRHQGFWNGANVRRFRRFRLVTPIIWLDTFVLALRVLGDRIRRVGIGSIFALPKSKPKVLYLDLGTHREGKQARLIFEWLTPHAELTLLGFDANPTNYSHFAQYHAPAIGMEVAHVALVGPDYDGKTIDLYLDGKEGLGDTILPQEGAEAVSVPAMRLSRWLHERAIVLQSQIVLLRMNIEGAEFAVLKDLADAGILGNIDGMYGMWNDVQKKGDSAMAAEFDAFLDRENIRNFTFNDRDGKSRFRYSLVRYRVMTDILAAQSRKPAFH